jgi:hypothetical protein
MIAIPMSKQEKKYHVSMAGEFFVAGELQRQGFSAAVTYGNAKKADVVAFSRSGEIAVVIEVKSTSQPKWIVGTFLPEVSPKPWVFVYLPTESTEAPIYYVLLQSELRDILLPGDLEYRQTFKAKHNEEYGDRAGVVSLTSKQAEDSKNAWWKITDQLLK